MNLANENGAVASQAFFSDIRLVLFSFWIVARFVRRDVLLIEFENYKTHCLNDLEMSDVIEACNDRDSANA